MFSTRPHWVRGLLVRRSSPTTTTAQRPSATTSLPSLPSPPSPPTPSPPRPAPACLHHQSWATRPPVPLPASLEPRRLTTRFPRFLPSRFYSRGDWQRMPERGREPTRSTLPSTDWGRSCQDSATGKSPSLRPFSWPGTTSLNWHPFWRASRTKDWTEREGRNTKSSSAQVLIF